MILRNKSITKFSFFAVRSFDAVTFYEISSADTYFTE